jgi:hypothetical protein
VKTIAAQADKQATDSTSFLSVMTSHFEKSWDDEASEVTDADGSTRTLTGRQMIAHLTALYGSPEARVHFVREQEKALDDAAYLLAALADPRHGAGSLEVRDTIESLTEQLNALRMLTPYQQKDGSLAV